MNRDQFFIDSLRGSMLFNRSKSQQFQRNRSRTQIAQEKIEWLSRHQSGSLQTASQSRATNRVKSHSVQRSSEPQSKDSVKSSFIQQIECVQLHVSETYNIPLNRQAKIKLISGLPFHVKQDYLSDQETWYPHSRLNHYRMQNQIQAVYGKDKLRWLYPGEESSIIDAMILFLEQARGKVKLLFLPTQQIIHIILQSRNLLQLKDMKVCMRQIEAHWKIMITRFYYQNQSIFKKTPNVLDRNQNSRLVAYFQFQ